MAKKAKGDLPIIPPVHPEDGQWAIWVTDTAPDAQVKVNVRHDVGLVEVDIMRVSGYTVLVRS